MEAVLASIEVLLVVEALLIVIEVLLVPRGQSSLSRSSSMVDHNPRVGIVIRFIFRGIVVT